MIVSQIRLVFSRIDSIYYHGKTRDVEVDSCRDIIL